MARRRAACGSVAWSCSADGAPTSRRWQLEAVAAGRSARSASRRCVALVLIAVRRRLLRHRAGPVSDLERRRAGTSSGSCRRSRRSASGTEPDFRFALRSGLLEPGVLLACAVVSFGLWWCWRRREWALLRAPWRGSRSTWWCARSRSRTSAARRSTVVAPLLTLVAVKALAIGGVQQPRAVGRARRCVGAYLLVAGASSTLVLRGAHVRPAERGHDLAAFRSIVDGQPTIYLGRDNFAPWELRGARLRRLPIQQHRARARHPRGPEEARGRRAPARRGRGLGRQVVRPRRRATSSRRVPPTPRVTPAEFRPIKRTRWHVLWERRDPLRPRADPRRGRGARKGSGLPNRGRPATGAHGRASPTCVRRRWSARPRGWAVRTVTSGGSAYAGAAARPRGLGHLAALLQRRAPAPDGRGRSTRRCPPYVSDESTFCSAGRVVSTARRCA